MTLKSKIKKKLVQWKFDSKSENGSISNVFGDNNSEVDMSFS